ncbi:MAG TPA: hypothetical protein VFI17_05355 [Solirubrobacterales bacterium]|nr:hypothetical protein [Solirubrobacterales bacterium]
MLIAGAGCGSSGSSSASTAASADTTTTSTDAESGKSGGGGKDASKAEFIKAGDAICASIPQKYQVAVKKLPKAAQENPKKAVPAAAVPPLREGIEEFAELAAPQGDEQKAEEILTAMEAAAIGLEKNPEGELGGPKSSFAEFNELTKAYGFKLCSSL